MSYEVKPLPFQKELIGISAKAIAIHHDKLYVGYVNKRNAIEEALTTADRASGDYANLKRGESFAANGVVLHEYYFNVLGGDGAAGGELQQALATQFGSYEKWEEDFKAAGVAARGWVVLAYDFNTGKLHNYACDAHNHGGIWGALPIIVLDVYEHAYFIDYGSDRKSYIEDYMKNLNWEKANELYANSQKMLRGLQS